MTNYLRKKARNFILAFLNLLYVEASLVACNSFFYSVYKLCLKYVAVELKANIAPHVIQSEMTVCRCCINIFQTV